MTIILFLLNFDIIPVVMSDASVSSNPMEAWWAVKYDTLLVNLKDFLFCVIVLVCRERCSLAREVFVGGFASRGCKRNPHPHDCAQGIFCYFTLLGLILIFFSHTRG